MARHRGFTRKKFVDAVGFDFAGEYMSARIGFEGSHDEFTEEVVDEILQQQDEITRKRIGEELHCINDVAEKGMDYLERAYAEYEVPFNDEWPRERLAMYLFLRNREAFGTAYDCYVWRTVANSMSHHQFTDVQPAFDQANVDAFAESIRQYYEQQAKGHGCRVRHYQGDDDTHVILVARGDYLQTQLIWDHDDVTTTIVRPAKEDVLCFSLRNSVLSLKTSGRSWAERENYIRTFGQSILGLAEIDPEVFHSTAVSLEPIRNGSFNYWGNEQIKWVMLTEVQMLVSGSRDTKVRLNCSDLVTAIRDDLPGFGLMNGTLHSVKLKFKINCEGASSRPLTVEIRPPDRTELNRKREVEIVEAYLRQNGVLLV